MNFKFATITVKDLDEALAFYTEVIGLSQVKRFSPREGVDIVFLDDGSGNKVELLENEMLKPSLNSETVPNLSLNYHVDDLEKVMEFLKGKNIEIKRGPVEIPTGRFITIEDPDGVQIGLHEED